MSDTSEADRILWRAWRRDRDDAVFADLVRPHLRFAADFARRLGLHDADADDIVQQAVAALAAEASDRPIEVGLRAWLGRYLVLHAKMLRRAGARRAKHERAAPPLRSRASDDLESREAVESLLGELPEPQREAVVLRFLHDLDYEDIAHITGASVNACRIRVHRGIERMRVKAGSKVGALVAALPLLHGRGEAALIGGTTKAITGVILMKKIVAVIALCVAGAGVLLYQQRDAGKTAIPRTEAARIADPLPDASSTPEPRLEEAQTPAIEAPRALASASSRRDDVLRAVFEAGGQVGFAREGETLRYFASRDELPEGPITAVQLRRGNPKSVLALLAEVGGIHTIDLFGAELDDEGLAVIGAMGALRTLNVSRTSVTDAGIEHLAGLSLRSLSMHDTKATEASAPVIARIATLERLRFETKSMSDGVFEHFGRLPALVELESRDIRVSADALRHLEGARSLRKLVLDRLASGGLAGAKNLTQLEELELNDSDVRGGDLRHIANLKKLRRLNLGETPVDAEGLPFLAGLDRLETLGLDETDLDDDGLAHLSNLRALKTLRLDQTGITSKGVKHLAGLTALERLDLDENEIGDEGIEHLLGLVNLKYLDLKGTKVTSQGVDRLQRALPDCRIRRP